MNTQDKIDSLIPWFYQVRLGKYATQPGKYPPGTSDRDKRSPEYFVNRQRCRRTLLVDAVMERYSFEGKKLLDVASNCGYWSSLYLKAGALSLTAIEGRQLFIDQAKLIYNEMGLLNSAIFINGNIMNLTYSQLKGAPFDFILCAGILYHIKNHEELLKRLSPVNTEVMLLDTRVDPLEGELEERRGLYFNAIDETRYRRVPKKEVLVSIMEHLGYSVEQIPPTFPPMIGVNGVDDYSSDKRITLFCRKRK